MYSPDTYSRLFHHARGGLLLIEAGTGQVVEVNASFLRMTARSRDEVVGRIFWKPPLVADPEAGAEVYAHLQAGHAVEDAVLPLAAGDGRWLLLEVSGSQPADGLVQLEVRDATTREQARLTARMDALQALSGRVAGEFYDLHRVFRMMGELLLTGGPGGPVFQEMQRAGQRAGVIARELRAFSGHLDSHTRPVALNTLIESTLPHLQRLLGRDIQIVRDLSADLRPVIADPVLIRQIILKLAANAREAMERGGVFRLETGNAPEVQAGLGLTRDSGGPYGMLAISDTGPGLDDLSWEHLYEPFCSTKTADRVRGLGLAAVYGIVRQSGGRLWTHSEPGKGACFRIYLPQATADFPALPLAPPDTPCEDATIFLVEVNDSLRMLMAGLLVRTGFRVLATRQAPDAWDLVATHGPPDLLISPPEPELARRLRTLAPRLRVLYLGGHIDEPGSQTLLPPGTSILRKPFEPDTLLAQIRALLAE